MRTAAMLFGQRQMDQFDRQTSKIIYYNWEEKLSDAKMEAIIEDHIPLQMVSESDCTRITCTPYNPAFSWSSLYYAITLTYNALQNRILDIYPTMQSFLNHIYISYDLDYDLRFWACAFAFQAFHLVIINDAWVYDQTRCFIHSVDLYVSLLIHELIHIRYPLNRHSTVFRHRENAFIGIIKEYLRQQQSYIRRRIQKWKCDRCYMMKNVTILMPPRWKPEYHKGKIYPDYFQGRCLNEATILMRDSTAVFLKGLVYFSADRKRFLNGKD